MPPAVALLNYISCGIYFGGFFAKLEFSRGFIYLSLILPFGEGRTKDGEIGKGQIGEGGSEENFLCLILTKEKCWFTEPPAVAVLNYVYTLANFLSNWNFRGVFCISLILLFIYVPTVCPVCV